ncbi:MAG TPA: DHA2 family efflux MFS transporter permease subunit [Candidatus Acidoferrales bacterium]
MAAQATTFGGMANQRVAAGINPWFIALTVTLATFMELLDTAIANVALPHIAGGLAVSSDESTWVLTSYLVANAIILPLSAWLSRVFGRKNYYMGCVATFTISSLLCGLAPSLGWLIFFRVLQGIGGGGLAPVEQAILVDTFPADKRAAAFALYSMAIVTAPAIGPPLGGWITDSFSWRWVFFINIPIGVISLFLTHRMVSDPPEFKREVEAARQAGKLSIDYIGIALVAIGFACLEVVLDRGEREDWFESHFILIFFCVAIVALVAAVIWELRYPDPVVELALLKERNFAISNAFYFMFGFTLFGSTVLIPQMLQSLYGYTATDAGLVLGPGALVIVFMAPFVVQLVKRISVAVLISVGFGILAVAMFTFASFNLFTNYGHEAWARAIQGLGLAFLFVPTSQLAYSYLPKNKNNKASSLTNLFRNQGGSFGIAFVTTMISRRSQYHQNILVSHISNAQNAFRNNAASTQAYLMQHGFSRADAAVHSAAQLYAKVQSQAAILSYLDCFWLLGAFALIGPVLASFIRKFNQNAGAGAAH